MEEIDYEDWLIEKSEIDGFCELDEYLKKAIYETELGFTDGEELTLYEIDANFHRIIFQWTGYEKEVGRMEKDFEESTVYAGNYLFDDVNVLNETLDEWAKELEIDWTLEILYYKNHYYQYSLL